MLGLKQSFSKSEGISSRSHRAELGMTFEIRDDSMMCKKAASLECPSLCCNDLGEQSLFDLFAAASNASCCRSRSSRRRASLELGLVAADQTRTSIEKPTLELLLISVVLRGHSQCLQPALDSRP